LDKSTVIKTTEKYISKGQIDLAIAEWEKFLSEKKDGNVYNLVGDLYLRKNDRKKAIESFKKAAEIFKDDGFILKAIALYKKILNISPKEVDVILALAELNREKGLTADAIENMIQAADIYTGEGKTEKAIEIYQRALELAPQRVTLKQKIIELYLKTGLYGEAVKQYLELASEYLSRGDLEKAKGYFLNAIETDKQNIPALLGLSEIAERNNDLDEAIVYMKNALNIAPDDDKVSLRYAELLIKKGAIDEARDTLERMLKLHPFNIDAKRLLGNLYLKEGDREKAWEELKPVVDDYLLKERWTDAAGVLEEFKELDSPDIRHRLARLYKGTGEKDKAIAILKELAKEYEDEGKEEEAGAFYREIIELDPEDQTAREKLKEAGAVQEVVEEEVEVIKEEGVEEEVSKGVEGLTPEEFETRKAEAEFYEQYGFKDEAIKLYEALLKFAPDNKEIKKKLQELRQMTAPAKEEATPVEEPPVEEAPAGVPEPEAEEETPGVRDEKITLTADKDSSLRDVILEFKKGIEKEVDAEDAETHYNLGIGYKEMGLVDEAIKEFLLASKDHSKTRQSMVMIALCHLDKGLYESAINVLNRVKESMSPSDEGYLDVLYELANAYLKNNDHDNALSLFKEIQAQDAQFRDVTKKIELVESLISAGKGKPRKRKDRVSYI
jgi:tetratricopeptide (TPR) repeat protein